MILFKHTSDWADEFKLLKKIYTESLKELVVSVEHVGSTAIPGIMAKPIIDIDIVIGNYEAFPSAAKVLTALGYRHNGDQGILHREAFKRSDEFVPHTGPKKKWINHHLYVCPEFSKELERQIIFRDYLRVNEEAKREYERIKLSITAKSNGDRKRYAIIKEAECRRFVEETLAAAGWGPDKNKGGTP